MAIRLPAEIPALKSKKPARKQAFLNLAPLTGIAFASNWLINKLNLNTLSVKTTIMTPSKKCMRL
ncbi:hypothetical protein [Klebsiella pneumoniae IS53]|nr:hypothetical protein [Klebsiella pneumoniae IS53]